MALDAPPPAAAESRLVGIAAQVVGLLVFVAGIAMIALVFYWTYSLFSGVDQQIAQVKPAPAATSSPSPSASPEGAKSPKVVVALPRMGPTLTEVSAILLIKLVALFVLGWVASLVAARGAALATGRRGGH